MLLQISLLLGQADGDKWMPKTWNPGLALIKVIVLILRAVHLFYRSGMHMRNCVSILISPFEHNSICGLYKPERGLISSSAAQSQPPCCATKLTRFAVASCLSCWVWFSGLRVRRRRLRLGCC
jgi:hypothetical protein